MKNFLSKIFVNLFSIGRTRYRPPVAMPDLTSRYCYTMTVRDLGLYNDIVIWLWDNFDIDRYRIDEVRMIGMDPFESEWQFRFLMDDDLVRVKLTWM